MKNKFIFDVKDITEMAIFVAIALILDKIKIPISITGGSLNLSMVPLIIFADRKGFIKGLIASSIVFGLLSCIIDGYGLITYPFDYLIAFSGYSFIGFLNTKINNKYVLVSVSFICAFATRMIGHTMSSMIIFSYSFGAAIIYNLIYVSLSVIVSYIALMLLIKRVEKLQIFKN